MIEEFDGELPAIDSECFVHLQATVTGNVSVAGPSLIMAGARVIGDYGRVGIAAGCTIEENCVLHAGSYDVWAAGGSFVAGVPAVVKGPVSGAQSRWVSRSIADIFRDIEQKIHILRKGTKLRDNKFTPRD